MDESLQLSRQQIMKTIGQWLSEGSGWTIKSVDGHYINLTKYKPLKGSSYIELPTELKNPKKGLINIKNKDDECLRWCHIRHLNPQEKNPQRINKVGKEMINELNYDGIEFPYLRSTTTKSKNRTTLKSTCLVMEKNNPFPFTYPKRLLKTK